MDNLAYRKCEACGNSVHIGSLCVCGNDLYGVITERKEICTRARARYALAMKELRHAHQALVRADTALASIEAVQQEKKLRS
jgi:hypothetical protein